MPNSLHTRVVLYSILTMALVSAGFALFQILLAHGFLTVTIYSGPQEPVRIAWVTGIGSATLFTLAWLHSRGHAWTVKAFTVMLTGVIVLGSAPGAYMNTIPQSTWLPVLVAFALTSLRWTLFIAGFCLVLVLAMWREIGAYQSALSILTSMLILITIIAGRKIQDEALEAERRSALEADRARAALAQMNADLEARVLRRTSQLSVANQNLQTTVDTLEQTRGELVRVEKQAALGRMMAGVAHELNTPIGNAQVASTTLGVHTREFLREFEQGSLRRSSVVALCATNQQACELIENGLLRASELIDGFKELAAHHSVERRLSFDLDQVVSIAMDKLQSVLQGMSLNVQIPSSIRMESYFDALERIIGHLVRNAVVHGLKGRSDGTVTVEAEQLDAGRVRLTVRDNGHGFPEENRDKLFDPFFSTTFGQGGSGIGLYLCHTLATERLGGTITAQNSTAGGAIFTVIMPNQSGLQ